MTSELKRGLNTHVISRVQKKKKDIKKRSADICGNKSVPSGTRPPFQCDSNAACANEEIQNPAGAFRSELRKWCV